MGIFDFLKRKRTSDTAPADGTSSVPAGDVPAAGMDNGPAGDAPADVNDAPADGSLSASISGSLTKFSVLEDSDRPEPGKKSGDGSGGKAETGTGFGPGTEEDDAISNERITKGTRLQEEYRVLSDAISGGMGSVWKVRRDSWNIDLAMKRPQPRFFAEGSSKRKERFIRECEEWIRLGLHPNIVSCYYVREIGGVPTIFSEWMENGSLADRIRDRSLYEGEPEEQQKRLLDIAVQFARGLRYAHEQGLIHQDVKPDNLLLTEEWDAKVADFGLAHARAAGQSAKVQGYTKAYSSSEQLSGREATYRSDIFSWAVSLVEMYRGERPWKSGEEAGRNSGVYLEECLVPMPKQVKKLLKECLEETPEKRPQDFAVIEDRLLSIYRELFSEDYPRPEPSVSVDTAGTLNNRALSFVDIGKPEEALKLWEEALSAMPGHLDARFNRELYYLRTGRKWDYSVIEELELAEGSGGGSLGRDPGKDRAGKGSLADLIREECGGIYEAPDPEGRLHFIEGEVRDAAIWKDTLYVSTVSTYHPHQFLGIKRLRADDLAVLDTDPMDAVLRRAGDIVTDELLKFAGYRKSTNVEGIALCPQKGLAAVLIDNSVCLYDLKKKKIIRESAPLRGKVWDPGQFSFHPDGDRLVVSCEMLNEDAPVTTILDVPKLRVTAMEKMRFVGFLKGGGCLLRQEKTEAGGAGSCGGLFAADKNGKVREVFRFEEEICRFLEYTSAEQEEPLLYYQYKDSGEIFCLDSGFRKIRTGCTHIPPAEDRKVVYYDCRKRGVSASGSEYTGGLRSGYADALVPGDPALGIAFLTAGDRLAAWDAAKGKYLCTFNLGEDQDGKFVYDREKQRVFFSLLRKPETAWFSYPFAPLLHRREDLSPAQWRLSRIVSQKELSEEEDNLRRLAEEFRALQAQDDREGMLALYRRGLDMDGFLVSPQAEEIEKGLSLFAQRTKIRGLRSAGILPEVPESALVSYSVRNYKPNLSIVRKENKELSQAYAEIRSEQGELLRRVDFPVKEELKNRDDMKCVYQDMDTDRERVLFYVPNGSIYRRDEYCGLYQTELRTGRTIRLSNVRHLPERGAFYMRDGSILMTGRNAVQKIDPENGETIRTYPVITTENLDYWVSHELDAAGGSEILPDTEKTGFFVMIPRHERPQLCLAFSPDGELLSWWVGEGKFSRKLFPFPGGRFVLEPTSAFSSKDGFRIYDIQSDREVYATPEIMRFAGAEPDGSRIYVEKTDRKGTSGTNDSGDDKKIIVYRVEYDYEQIVPRNLQDAQEGTAQERALRKQAASERTAQEERRWKALNEALAPEHKAEAVHEFTEDEMRPKSRDLGRKIVVEEGDGVVRVKADLWLDRHYPFIQNDPILIETFSGIVDDLGDKGKFLIYPFGAIPAIQLIVEAPDFETCKQCCRKYREALKKSGHLKEGW